MDLYALLKAKWIGTVALTSNIPGVFTNDGIKEE